MKPSSASVRPSVDIVYGAPVSRADSQWWRSAMCNRVFDADMGASVRGIPCPTGDPDDIDSRQTPRTASPCEPPQGRKAARISRLWRVCGGSLGFEGDAALV